MTNGIPAKVCYLLLMPLRTAPAVGLPEPAQFQKDTPYFFDLDIDFVSTERFQLTIEDAPINILCQILDDKVWLAECHYQLADLFSETSLMRKRTTHAALKEKLRHKMGYTGAFVEEYTILMLGKVEPTPDEFIDGNVPILARWLRSLDKPLTRLEAQDILRSRARYSDRDLTVVDREGALIIAEEEAFEFDLTLLKLGNYQLLRYRLLDRAAERHLQQLREYVGRLRPVWLPSKYKVLQKIVEQRLTLLLDFEKIDQSLLLIGDWYSARVYRLIVEQFYLDDWKTVIRNKTENLMTVNDIIYQDMAFSWRRLLDFIIFAGWLILLVGYFILFFANLQ